MYQARPHARHFVGSNTRTHATTANGHTAIHFAASNRTSQGHNKIRIVVIRLQLTIAKINYFVVSLTQHPSQILF